MSPLEPFPWAYIDPVSGSILLQVIFAGVIGAFAYFFRPLVRIGLALLGRKPPPGDNHSPPPDHREPQ